MKLADISIRRPVLMTMIISAFVVMGVFSFLRLGIDLMPEVEFPFISVLTIYPGAGPQEIETLINKPLEEEVSSVEGVRNLYAIAQEGVSLIWVELELSRNIDVGAIDVKDKVDAIRHTLPEGMEDPVVQKFSFASMPIVNLSLTGPYSTDELYNFADKQIKPELGRIAGLANIQVIGGKERELEVSLDAAKLRMFGVSPMQVVMALSQENLQLPAGRIERGRSEWTLRLAGEYSSVADIGGVRIQTPTGPVRIDQLAKVRDTFTEQREMARFNNEPSIGLNLVKRSDANTVQVAEQIRAAVTRLKPRMPEGMVLNVARDNSRFIRESVEDVRSNLIMGILFTALVLYLFLHTWRGTVIAALTMPVSIISTFILVQAAGFTLNMMSLMGLAISVGILVVNAIVVLENIERKRAEGMGLQEAASVGTREIAIAVAASTLTNIVVFTPMAFMQGIVGQFFKEFGLTVAFATIFSLFVSFTLTPMMAARPMKKSIYALVGLTTFLAVYAFVGVLASLIMAGVVLLMAVLQTVGLMQRFAAWWDRWYDELASDYRVGLQWALSHRILILGGVGILFVFGLFLFKFIGSEFMPSYDERALSVSIEMPAGTRLEETNKVLYRVERELAAFPEIENIYTNLGRNTTSGLGGGQGVQYGEVMATLRPRVEGGFPPTADVVKNLRVKLADIPAAKIIASEVSQFHGGGGESDIMVELQGKVMDDLVKAADYTTQLIQSTGNAVNVRNDWRIGKPEIVVTPNRARLFDRGGTVQDVAMTLRTMFEGTVMTRYREAGEEFDVRVKLQASDRSRVDLVEDMLIPLTKGFVPLKEVASVEFSTGPTVITRKNKMRMVTVSADVAHGTSGQLQTDISRALQLPPIPAGQQLRDILTGISTLSPRPSPVLPEGVTAYFGGSAERMSESFTSLLQALVLAIILTFMLMAAIIESYRSPLIIMATLPLGLIGVTMALVMTGKAISIISMMSIVMLVGIVVNNGILLIDYMMELRRNGVGLREAILNACPVRLRPIIMSTLATSLGMLPLAMGLGAGGEFRSPMAVVAIGGLIVSTVLTLFVIPVLFSYLEARGEKLTGDA